MDLNEFGVKHPHECDCGEDYSKNALIMCILANMKLNDEVNALKKEVMELKKASERPRVANLEFYKDYVDLSIPVDMSREEFIEKLKDIINDYMTGEWE